MAMVPQTDILRRQYKIKCIIGRGAFGCVKLARHRFTRTLVAIKTLENLPQHLRIIKAELATLQSLQHPNIIQLFQIIVTQEHTHIITEYAPGGNLNVLVKKVGRLQEEKAQTLFGQLVSAIRYCHDRDIIHRDLKPQNILLDAEGKVKVADFGLATRCRVGTVLQDRCGTNIFNAPELILREGYDGKKADVWSLGVVLYYITIGHHPFKGSTLKDTEENIIQGSYEVPSHVSGQLENLIHQMLTVAQEKRPCIEDVEQHPWVMRCEDNTPDDTYPDPNILDILSDFGFDANAIIKSLQRRKYDEMMGTYLIIKKLVHNGHELDCSSRGKPEDADPTFNPSPVQRLRRRASEPIFVFHHSSPSLMHLPDILTLGKKLTRSASLPQCCTQRKIVTCTHTPLSRTVAAPCVSSSKPEEKMPLPPVPVSDREAASSPQNIGCFKRLRKRVMACLSRWCCCFSGSSKTQSQHRFNNRVVPLKEAGGRA